MPSLLPLHGLSPSPSVLHNPAGFIFISNINIDINTPFPNSHVNPSRTSHYSETDHLAYIHLDSRAPSSFLIGSIFLFCCISSSLHFLAPFMLAVFQGPWHRLVTLAGMCFFLRPALVNHIHYWNLSAELPAHISSWSNLKHWPSSHLRFLLRAVMFKLFLYHECRYWGSLCFVYCPCAWHRVGMGAQWKHVEWVRTVKKLGHSVSRGQAILASVPGISYASNIHQL